jgi:hypothetical protein
VGALTGARVGAFVGDLVGAFVGALVGVFVGDFVGALVGVFVGDFVGALVGAFVGDFVGAFVGDFVGALVVPELGPPLVCCKGPNHVVVPKPRCKDCSSLPDSLSSTFTLVLTIPLAGFSRGKGDAWNWPP